MTSEPVEEDADVQLDAVDTTVRSPQQELKGHTGSITFILIGYLQVVGAVIACDFIGGGDKIISASWDGTVRLWSITGETVGQITPGENAFFF